MSPNQTLEERWKTLEDNVETLFAQISRIEALETLVPRITNLEAQCRRLETTLDLLTASIRALEQLGLTLIESVDYVLKKHEEAEEGGA